MAKHNVTGAQGEEAAQQFLKRKRYRVLERNIRTRLAEIDLVCRSPRRDTLVFVEVRARPETNAGSREESIGRAKRTRLVRAAEAYVALKNYTGMYRIDAVCIVFSPSGEILRINHYENITE